MIRSLDHTDHGIEVDVDGRTLQFGWIWLRDHARDPASFMASAQQRLVTPTQIAAAGQPVRVEVVSDGSAFDVTWGDGTVARFDSDFVASLGDQTVATRALPEPEAWVGADMAARHQPIGFDDVVDDAGTRRALARFWRDGVIVVDCVPTHVEATRRVIERFGYIRETIFGGLWEYGNDGAYDDTASTSLEITPHTDATYSHDAPGLLALHCHRYAATGGENVFVDGITLASRLTENSRSVLSSTDVPAQYIGNGVHLMSRRPALRLDGDRLVQISYNHHDRAPFVLPEPQMSALYEALHELDGLANDPELQFEVALRPGDMVLFDNHRVLHGRRAFEGNRWIAGGYVNREDVESTTRLLTP